MQKYVLVTGGAGFIGAQICKDLSACGYTPVTFDNLSRGHRSSVKWGPLFVGDLSNSSDLLKCFESFTFVAVIHCAGLAYVAESAEIPLEYFEINVKGTINLLRIMSDFSQTKIVFSSTCSVYGNTNKKLISEDTLAKPINTYAKTKMTVEMMLNSMSDAGMLKFVALRFFNVAGADVNGLGELHEPETHVIPLIIEAALKDSPFTIFGDDYDTEDGTCIRDYVHVIDIADAHVKAIDYLINDGKSLVVNLGTGNGVSVNQLVKEVELATGKTLSKNIETRRIGDPDCLIANPKKAKELLGWSANNSDLQTIINSAVWWGREQIEKNS